MASLEGCPPSAAFALLRAFSAKGRAFRMPQRRTHRGGENGISSLSGRLVAQRRGGLPEPVHQLLGWWLHARGAMVSPSRAGHVGASRPGVRQPAQLDRTLARRSCCADRSGPRFGPPNCQPGRTGPRTPCTRRSSSRGQGGTYPAGECGPQRSIISPTVSRRTTLPDRWASMSSTPSRTCRPHSFNRPSCTAYVRPGLTRRR